MAVRLVVSDVVRLDDKIWLAPLSPDDARRFGDTKTCMGQRSVLGVTAADFDEATGALSIDPAKTVLLNIGSSGEAVVVDLGCNDAAKASQEELPTTGDQRFVAECTRQLGQEFGDMARQLLADVRHLHQGHMHEGQARKWVNYPGNFVAITIQPRDRSLAIHVKGNPDEFRAQSLGIRADRPSYSRFKLESRAQLSDAIRVVIQSADRLRR